MSKSEKPRKIEGMIKYVSNSHLKVEVESRDHHDFDDTFIIKILDGYMSTALLNCLITDYFYPYINELGINVTIDRQFDDDNVGVFNSYQNLLNKKVS